MSIQETAIIKKELSQWINSLNDERMLNLLESIKNSLNQSSEDWWDNLTSTQQSNIQLGMKDVHEGQIISSDTFWRRLRDNA